MSPRARTARSTPALVAILGALCVPSMVSAQGPSAQEPCELDPRLRAPDLRCGERLDGRVAAAPSDAVLVPRAVLWVPRMASRALFWPVVTGTDFVESHHLMNWLQALFTTDDGLIGVRPAIKYSTGFLPTVGLRVFDRRLPGPGSGVSGRFDTGGPQAMMGQLDVSGPNWLGLSASAGWSRRNDRLFAGMGPSSASDLAAQGRGPARYGSQVLGAELRWMRRLPAQMLAGLHADVQRHDHWTDHVSGGPSVAERFGLSPAACMAAGMPVPCVDPALVPGFGGVRIAHAGAEVGIDALDRARDGSGASLTLGGTLARGVAEDPSRHLILDSEAVAAIGGHDRALLLRGQASVAQALSAAPIPFEELVSPSGHAGMRGFAEGRFRGPSGVVASAEYRWFVAYNLDASLFVDYGTVAGEWFSGLDRGRWFPSFGGGLRLFDAINGLYWQAPLESGVQLAYAPDAGLRLLLSIASF